MAARWRALAWNASLSALSSHARFLRPFRRNGALPGGAVPPTATAQVCSLAVSQRQQVASSPAAAEEAEACAAELCVRVPPRCISIVRGPQAFYSAVVGFIELARRRLLVAALYIGTEEKERLLLHELLNRVVSRQQQNQQHDPQQPLQVRLLLDFLRSTRPGASRESPATLLLPLLQHEPPHTNCQVSLFCNPLTCSSSSSSSVRQLLQRLLRGVLGHRQKEVFGTQHIKCIVSDDLVLLTGANLSADYFSNRADRCICIRSKPLADAVDAIVAAAEAHSFRPLPPQTQQQQQHERVDVGGVRCVWPEGNPSKPPQVDPQGFCHSLSKALAAAFGSWAPAGSGHVSSTRAGEGTCLVSLAVQAGFASPPIRGQELLLERTYKIAAASVAAAAAAVANTSVPTAFAPTSLGHVDPGQGTDGIQVTIASPYLNFPQTFLKRLQQLVQQMRTASASARGTNSRSDTSSSSDSSDLNTRLLVITASPEANSFFKSNGLSYWIPHAYAVAAHATSAALRPPACSAAAASPALLAAAEPQGEPPADNLKVLEYAREGWTFHSKGIWITSSSSNSSSNSCKRACAQHSMAASGLNTTRWLLDESLMAGPNRKSEGWGAASLLGSSNLSVRSSARDLELLAMLLTRDRRLEQEQQKEVDLTLLPFCRPVDEQILKARYPAWLRVAVLRLFAPGTSLGQRFAMTPLNLNR
ncbi:hypothetical protein Esti_003186 [Eimeria stiedai]